MLCVALLTTGDRARKHAPLLGAISFGGTSAVRTAAVAATVAATDTLALTALPNTTQGVNWM